MANPPPSSTTLSDNDRMMEMINGYWITQIVNAAATYALADHLAKGPAAAAEIAEMANTDPSATFRLLRACASLGLVTYDGECRFTATSLLNTLRTDNAQSLRDLAMLMAGPGNWRHRGGGADPGHAFGHRHRRYRWSRWLVASCCATGQSGSQRHRLRSPEYR